MNRLDPRIRLIWILEAVTGAVIVGVGIGLLDRFILRSGQPVAVGVALLVLVVGVFLALLRYRTWGFEVRDDAVYLERGVGTRVKTIVPFVRLQHVDARRNPVERLTGLATVVIYTAGSRGADVTIPGLTPERAYRLQETLKRLATEVEATDAV